MSKICNFPVSEIKRCKQLIADDKPNCGRHRCEASANQLGVKSTVYQKDGILHVWRDEPDGLYCLIHSDPAYQVTYQLAGETPPCCLAERTERTNWRGALHRKDGPALIELDGTQRWYRRGKLHRRDGPAVIHADGTQSWYWHNKLHREDGPAVIGADGTREWYLHGEEITEQEHGRLRR